MDISDEECPANEKSFDTKGMQTNEDEVEEKFALINVPMKCGVIVLLNHPASYTVYKYVSIQVISGTVSINGYEITKNSKPLEVFSSEKTSLIAVKTETYERIWKKREYASNLEQELVNITGSGLLSTKILQKFGNTTVAIFVKRNPFPFNVEFIRFYYPEALDFNLFKKSGTADNFYVPQSKGKPLHFGLDEENVASEINGLIRSTKVIESDNPRIIVCGRRNTGKSTLLQFLLNKILSVYPCAYYLDTDPGQPEFTPPGVVSLTKVTKPVFGPPFCHQLKPIKMMFIGSVSPSYIDLYTKSISELMELYDKDFAHEPLFVNTMGWMEGTGLQCLTHTIAAVKPTVLIETVTENETSMFDYREYLPSSSQYFQISATHKQKTSYFPPKRLRELSLLSHLGKCNSRFVGALPVNEVKPYCVPWDKFPLFIFPGGNVLPSRYFEAMNNSIVALCSVPESVILESDVPEFPRTLEHEPENECLAYGLVQAVDEKERLFYIVTSLKSPEWINVNAIMKGHIVVPDALITEQDIYNVPLPFTDVREDGPSEEDMDVSMVSLKYLFDAESPTVNNNACASIKNYRKSVPTRHRNKINKK